MATIAPLRFAPIGFGYVVCLNSVWMISRCGTTSARRAVAQAKKDSKYIDCTYSRATKSLLYLDNGCVIGCTFSPDAMLRRFMKATSDGVLFDNGKKHSYMPSQDDEYDGDDEDENEEEYEDDEDE